MSISAVTSDAAGRVTSWKEGEYAFTVSRDAAGRPLFVRGVSPGRMQEGGEFRYLSSGAFSGFEGATGSVMLSALLRDATAGGAVPMLNKPDAFPTLAALAAEDATKYAPGTIVRVGPDPYGQYAEWYPNGVRWRPRNGLLYVKNTPASLPDTTSTETDVWSYTIPAGLLGPNDIISSNWFWSYTNNATNKQFKLYFGGQSWVDLTTNAGAGFRGTSRVMLRNSNTVQVWPSSIHGVAFADGSGSSGGALIRNVDTTQDVIVKAAGKWASGGGGANNITLEYLSLRLEFEA